ncbi:MAG: mannose-1-phosphate guanylyltransferase/mannose-6-phosphate isomerase [Desulfococcaceae bacterium]
MICPVILAGGSGTRLWPLSRELWPKQLIELTGEHTMLQDTVLRLKDFAGMQPPMIICNEKHRFMVAEQLRMIDIRAASILLEPVGRNTAPAVCLAALKAVSAGDDPLLLVLPADHFIKDIKAFHQALETAAHFAEQDFLITFGIVPESPETGYGYIRKGKELSARGDARITGAAFAIEQFVEKPDAKTAEQYLKSGAYCWNSGMFMFRASAVLAGMEKHVLDILNACRNAMEKGKEDLDFFRVDTAAFEACPSDSIDYAIMEKTDKGAMVPFQAGWNDLGSWEALWQTGAKDSQGNVVQGDVLLHDVHDSYLHAGTRLLAAVGLENHIVVETADAVLISPRSRVQDVKILVNRLKSASREETVSHKKRYMPWGSAETLVKSGRFIIKRVKVKPGAVISLQTHFNRAEHWIVLSGTAQVIKGNEEIILTEDRSTYIPPGMPHRLVNPGKIPLEMVEVQSGSYLGEDDIARLEDVYLK